MKREKAKVEKVKVNLSLPADFVEHVDVVAERAGMDRSEFLATLVEIALEEHEPFVNFAAALGRVRAKLIWPKWRPKVQA